MEARMIRRFLNWLARLLSLDDMVDTVGDGDYVWRKKS
jgi:hypothetical protein